MPSSSSAPSSNVPWYNVSRMAMGVSFRISPQNCGIWFNSYQHLMQFDMFQTSWKLWLTWVGVQSSQCLKTICLYREKPDQGTIIYASVYFVSVIMNMQYRRTGAFLYLETLMFDTCLSISSSGNITVTSGIISFRTHPGSSRHIWFWYMLNHVCGLDFLFLSDTCPSCFHWFPCAAPSRIFFCQPRRPPRQISTDSHDFESRYEQKMPFIYGHGFEGWMTCFFSWLYNAVVPYSGTTQNKHSHLCTYIYIW
jgi:hypothetical protein